VGRAAWCIFDNTTLGAAAANALDLAEMMQPVMHGRGPDRLR
jgi:hypothetical protein